MNRVTHFEIYTDDPEAVQPFYQDLFGWLAYAEDPAGNVFGIIEPNTEAK